MIEVGYIYRVKDESATAVVVDARWMLSGHPAAKLRLANGGEAIGRHDEIVQFFDLVGLQLPDGRRIMIGDRRIDRLGIGVTMRGVDGSGQVRVASDGYFDPDIYTVVSADYFASLPPASEPKPAAEYDTVSIGGVVSPGFNEARRQLGDAARKVAEAMSRATTATSMVKPHDPRAANRRAIDAVLAEDARRHPAFATARKAAVLGAMECDKAWTPVWVCDLCALLRSYEDARGGMSRPSTKAELFAEMQINRDTIAVYERCRSLS